MSQKKTTTNNWFARLSLTTLIAVYFLIFVGGVVRSTGSGMGCPDWPKCFGQWVPPTNADQLPSDYQQTYVQERAQKNMRLANYLESMGITEKAAEIRNDQSILAETDFNSFKTWTEYINRLVGAFIGLLVIATFVASFKLWRSRPNLVFSSGAALILVVFQGWLGSLVVSTNLLPWMVTVHMLLALVIVAVLMYNVFKTRTHQSIQKFNSEKLVNGLLVTCMLLMLVQIAMGTQVREMIDTIAASLNYENRSSWISGLGLEFYVHRSFSLLILGVHAALTYVIYQKIGKESSYYIIARVLVLLIVAEIITGAAMAYFSIPAMLQPIHLLLASILFGVQFLFFLEINYSSQKQIVLSDNYQGS